MRRETCIALSVFVNEHSLYFLQSVCAVQSLYMSNRFVSERAHTIEVDKYRFWHLKRTRNKTTRTILGFHSFQFHSFSFFCSQKYLDDFDVDIFVCVRVQPNFQQFRKGHFIVKLTNYSLHIFLCLSVSFFSSLIRLSLSLVGLSLLRPSL